MDCQENVLILSSYFYNCRIECISMNDEDRKYLISVEKMRPSFEVFERMVQILTSEQEETDRLLYALNTSLLETSKPI